MKPAYLVYLASVRKALARKQAENNFRFKCDLNSSTPSKAPIII